MHELIYLFAMCLCFINDFHCRHVIDTRIQPDLVHDGNSCTLCTRLRISYPLYCIHLSIYLLVIQLFHLRRYVACCHHVLAVVNAGLGNSVMQKCRHQTTKSMSEQRVKVLIHTLYRTYLTTTSAPETRFPSFSLSEISNCTASVSPPSWLLAAWH